jgi:hypothetical protein
MNDKQDKGFSDFIHEPGIYDYFDRINGKVKKPLTRVQRIQLWFSRILRRLFA